MSGAAESSNKEETLGISANEPLNETEAAERFEAAANKLLGVANETLAAVRSARKETRAALDDLEARLAASRARRETRMALHDLEDRLASSDLWEEKLDSVKRLRQSSAAPHPERLKPAVPIRRSADRLRVRG